MGNNQSHQMLMIHDLNDAIPSRIEDAAELSKDMAELNIKK
jgi:hypothetical protein